MREKSGAFSGSDDPRLLGEDAQFLQALLRRPPEPAPKASVEGLQEMARVRLCLDRAADILTELRKGSGKSSLRTCSTWAPSPIVRKLGGVRGAGTWAPPPQSVSYSVYLFY